MPSQHLVSVLAGVLITLVIVAVTTALPLNRQQRTSDPESVAPLPTATPTPALHTITGNIVLLDREAGWTPDEPCGGRDATADLQSGTQIVVRDESNTVIAVTRLQAGRGYRSDGPQRQEGQEGEQGEEGQTVQVECAFVFQIPGIPRTDFYQIQIAGRSPIVFSHADLEQLGWVLTTRLASR